MPHGVRRVSRFSQLLALAIGRAEEGRPLFAGIPQVAEAQPGDRSGARARVLWKKKEPQR